MALKAVKGFNKDMTCRGYQYTEGKTHEFPRAKCCEEGGHACEHPLDCFSYYSPNESVYHEVELDGDIDKEGSSDSKVAATKLTVGARLSIAGLVQAAIDFTMSKVKKEADSDEEHGFASATGDYGASSATGDYGASSATGYKGASSATGDYGASSATGNCGASSATGYKGASSACNSTAVAVAWGYEAKAKGVKGAHLVLSDWRYTGPRYWDGDPKYPHNQDYWELAGAKLVIVDGETIKEDTYYRCVEGEVVEAD